MRCQCHAARDTEQIFDVGLALVEQQRQRTAEALGAQGEQDVLDEGVDRRAASER
jgi:hypothetical protein